MRPWMLLLCSIGLFLTLGCEPRDAADGDTTTPEEGLDTVTSAEPDTSEPSGTTDDDTLQGTEPEVEVCPTAAPDHLEMGAVALGTSKTLMVTIENPGDEPMVLSRVALEVGGSPAATDGPFKMSLPVPGGDDGDVYDVALDPHETLEVAVTYTPLDQSPLDGTGSAVGDLAHLVIEAEGCTPRLDIQVLGAGYDQASGTPPATIHAPTEPGQGGDSFVQIQEGLEVAPQTLLHLSAPELSAAGAPLSMWQWEVTQPEGSVAKLLPASTVREPTLEVNVAGSYELSLTTTDTNGVEVDHGVVATVMVVPDQTIHVELLWTTPGDADETDEGFECGTDLDLHVAVGDPVATEDGLDLLAPWFDEVLDCFWFTRNPNWGSLDLTDDDPGLDRDDTDGAGPENMNLDLPTDGTYTIGVHYWDAHGFGASDAVVKVYVGGELVYTSPTVSLAELDLWEVATIDWPSGQVTELSDGGAPLVTSDFEPAGFMGE